MVQAIVCPNNIDEFREAKKEGREFIKIHNEVTQTSYGIGMYQYELLEETKKYLTLKTIQQEDYGIKHKYKKYMLLPMPLHKQEQDNYYMLDKALQEGGLDFLHN